MKICRQQALYLSGSLEDQVFGWMQDIYGQDGYFLKALYGGQLLSTVDMDPNDQIYPISYAVVELKIKESWTWFLQALLEDVEIQNQSGMNYKE